MMKKYYIIIFLMLFGQVAGLPLVARAEDDPPLGKIIINEILPGTAESASQEFIELYNPGDEDVDIAGWRLQYASETGFTWRSLSIIETKTTAIEREGFYLYASEDYLPDQADASFNPTLAQAGGQLRLLDAEDNLQDQVSWGKDAAMPLGQPAPSPDPSQSISRKLVDNLPSMENDNSKDFILSDQPTPGATNVQPDEGSGADIRISELLPNPAEPQTDGNDEFVELYNSSSEPVDLTDYTITTGASDNYRYKIESVTINPGGYATFFSKDTPLVLSNSGGKASLLAPDGSKLDETDSYGAAPDGQAWAWANELWQWTTTPTPGAVNIITVPPPGDEEDDTPPPIPSGPYADLEISELLPNPASPQTDAIDEFVEIHNPGNQTVDLTGYVIVTGSNDSYKHELESQTIGPGQYLVFYSGVTNLALSNTSGRAKVLAPDHSLIDETGSYSNAPDGQAWIFAETRWQWTGTSTPGRVNVYTPPVTKASSSKKPSSKKTSKKRSSAVKGASLSTNNPTITTASTVSKSSNLHPLVLVAVGVLALLYALYEYRHDLANQLHRLRRYRASRRASG